MRKTMSLKTDRLLADVIDKEKIYAYMPSDFLIQHEWDKHGTCSGLARSAHFDLTGNLFGKLKFPRLSGAPKADKIEALLMENNPGLDADEIHLSCTENGPKQRTDRRRAVIHLTKCGFVLKRTRMSSSAAKMPGIHAGCSGKSQLPLRNESGSLNCLAKYFRIST
jgi:ribonuclease T2